MLRQQWIKIEPLRDGSRVRGNNFRLAHDDAAPAVRRWHWKTVPKQRVDLQAPDDPPGSTHRHAVAVPIRPSSTGWTGDQLAQADEGLDRSSPLADRRPHRSGP